MCVESPATAFFPTRPSLDRDIIAELLNDVTFGALLSSPDEPRAGSDERRGVARIWYWLAVVLVYDLLFGKKKIEGGGFAKKTLTAARDELQERLQQMMADRRVSSPEQLLPDNDSRQFNAISFQCSAI